MSSASLSWPARALRGLLQAYRLLLSPWIGSACRFTPTCSVYGLEAIERHGAARGGLLTARRLLRCHPACAGGCDPVPQHLAPGWLLRRHSDPTSSSSSSEITP